MLPQKTFYMRACTHNTCTCSGDRNIVHVHAWLVVWIWNWVFSYFKISRALRVSCWCLPFNLKKMAAVSVTMFQEYKVLCQGPVLWVSDVDTSLLSMLQGLLSTLKTSESFAGRLYSVLQQQVRREIVLTRFQTISLSSCGVWEAPRFLQYSQPFELGGRRPHSFEQLTGAHHQRCAAGSSIRNTTAPCTKIWPG